LTLQQHTRVVAFEAADGNARPPWATVQSGAAPQTEMTMTAICGGCAVRATFDVQKNSRGGFVEPLPIGWAVRGIDERGRILKWCARCLVDQSRNLQPEVTPA